jgi:retron-type reverse transcriptase
MLKPDSYFKNISHYFQNKNHRLARQLFRRAIRDYYVMRRRLIFDPISGQRVESIFVGEFIQQQQNQKRKVKKVFKGNKGAGRPVKHEISVLMSRLFIMWGRFAKTDATFSWKMKFAIKTDFEEFLDDLMPKLGATDVRRYVESHWKARK